MLIDVTIEEKAWDGLPLQRLANAAISTVFQEIGLDARPIEIALLACSDARIAELNSEFRDKATPTNVLSWPAQDLVPPSLPTPDPDGSMPLGDIALAFETCEREARDAKKSLEDHLSHLVVHGALHLLGYDHISDTEAEIMEGLERKILGKLGISDPY